MIVDVPACLCSGISYNTHSDHARATLDRRPLPRTALTRAPPPHPTHPGCSPTCCRRCRCLLCCHSYLAVLPAGLGLLLRFPTGRVAERVTLTNSVADGSIRAGRPRWGGITNAENAAASACLVGGCLSHLPTRVGVGQHTCVPSWQACLAGRLPSWHAGQGANTTSTSHMPQQPTQHHGESVVQGVE